MNVPAGSEEAHGPGFRAAIFDVDGVLVDSPHERAWRDSLCDLMKNEWREIRDVTGWSADAFTTTVYRREVSGKPRLAGARSALEYFSIPDDDEGSRLATYAERKQEMVMRLIESGEFEVFPDALRFLIAVRDAGLATATASSSRNAEVLLGKVRLDTFAREQGIESPTLRPDLTLLDYFDLDVSGREFERGKPHPEMFLTAARELGVEPRHALVLEDAAAGVEAAKAGGMPAIGIARGNDAGLLAEAGADIVVTTLDSVNLAELAAGRLNVG